jgi:hypothetical protein
VVTVTRALLVASLALLMACAAAGQAQGQITVRCFSPQQTACSGHWHVRDVQVDWTIEAPFAPVAGCRDETINWDTTGARRSCTAQAGPDDAARSVTVSVDRTPPLLTGASASRPPDTSGWYRMPLAVSFTGTDVTSGIEGCTTTTYAGPDTAVAAVAGTCRDRAGNTSAPGRYGLRFDATPPVVREVKAARSPDHRGWYTRPVGFSVSATDATSGLAGCDPLILGGPDGPAVPVSASCRDRAGNATSRAFAAPFDATAPLLGRLRVRAGDRRVRLDWGATGAVGVEVSRSPGRRGEERTVLQHGAGTRLVDEHVRNGRRYEYRITAVDRASNVATRIVAVRPGPRLLAPGPGAAVSAPPLLRWTPVRGARYYNVQLFHRGRKVLSAWPTASQMQLQWSWRYRGRRELGEGRNRWLVWPGRGARADNRYGSLIGSRAFVVNKP